MLKKFFEGIIFGVGLAISFALVYSIVLPIVLPFFVTSYATHTKEPIFENPSEAVVKEAVQEFESEQKEFNLFKSRTQMVIPAGGGILSMSPITTAKGSKRPSTYQLWLTETALWQIRTVEEKVEIEELSYPKNGGGMALHDLMLKKIGMGSSQSSMTVSPVEISHIRTTGGSSQDETLNGILKITVEGVVFLLPNPYGT